MRETGIILNKKIQLFFSLFRLKDTQYVEMNEEDYGYQKTFPEINQIQKLFR